MSTNEYALSEREELETSLIRNLIASYFSIVRQTIQDLVPKAVMHLLVNFSRESVQNRLVASLYKENLFADLLEEDEGLTNERKRVQALLDAYKQAFNGERDFWYLIRRLQIADETCVVLSEVTFKQAP